MIKGKKIISALLIGTLCLGMSTQVRATEIDDTKQKAEELQKQKEAAESEQKSLETQLMAIVSEMEDTKNQISQKNWGRKKRSFLRLRLRKMINMRV